MKILSIDLDFISGPAILHNDQKIYEHNYFGGNYTIDFYSFIRTART